MTDGGLAFGHRSFLAGRFSAEPTTFLHTSPGTFLLSFSETYQMIEQCDPSIASWSLDGESFIIRDVNSFAKNILPQYFKHSKFPSFVRQLNFYSFRKLRDDSSKKSVRFSHTNFRQGRPELLQLIQRCTRVCDGSSSEIKSLKDDLVQMNMELEHLSHRMDSRLQEAKSSMEDDYQRRMARLALYYQALSQSVAQNNPKLLLNLSPSPSRPDSPPVPKLIHSPSVSSASSALSSPRSSAANLSALDTLSGVAALLRETGA